MLGKLLKYEFKATARLFVPLYLALIAFAVINRVIKPFQVLSSSVSHNLQSILSLLSIMVYFILIVAVVAVTVIIMIQRFYKNLLGDEGYLMFTLPVHTWKHIVSKLIVAMVWTILSFMVTAGSILIFSQAGANVMEIMQEMAHAFRSYCGVAGFLVLPAAALISLASGILMIYAAIALGHLFSRHKLLASFGMYCALYIVSQIITIFIMMLYIKAFRHQFPVEGTVLQVNLTILFLSLPSVLLGAGYYILTGTILKKKLNLE